MPQTQPNLNTPTGDEVTTTTCYMCACRCGIRVHLKNGHVRYIDGNPAHPVNHGVICAKGSAGLKQHYSPARLTKPLLRVGERGEGVFREIEWDEALELAAGWLRDIRASDPDALAFFTGRDQSQALTGWWAQQFGTFNYAAHGGFCSVNMACAGMYSFGGSFWEFGEPDWEHTKYLMLWGVAEDHDSNPIKLGLGQLKARGAKIVAINPVRTGYGAIADEWVPINPGTDGLLAGALIHELLHADRVDLEYLVRYTNAHHLVIQNPGGADDGLIARDADGHALCAVRVLSHGRDDSAVAGPAPSPQPSLPAAPGEKEPGAWQIARADASDMAPLVVGEYVLADGRRCTPAFHLLAQRFMDAQYAPQAVAQRCGIPAATIERLARELAQVAFDQAITLKQPWTDCHGRHHETMLGRPVAMHAMRGIAAHVNGFHTCRAIHVLQMLLGAIDTPGSFRYQPPYPKPAPPGNKPAHARRSDGSLDGGPLGYVQAPQDLLVDADGQARRLDEAFSWRYPLAAHGMLQSVIRNAVEGHPRRIDTLFLFMANMGWNSAMNTSRTQAMLCQHGEDGGYAIPHIIYVDAYHSEMVDYADLVLPDTTYLERHDCISLLDRPISDADGAADAIRQPVIALDRDVRPFQSMLLDLGARLGLPGMVDAQGQPLYADYADYMARHERAPGVGLLAGWRGVDGMSEGRGAPNPEQIQRYIENGCFWRTPVPAAGRYYKMANRDYLEWAKSLGFVKTTEPIVFELYCETLQRFRLAAQGHGEVQPPQAERARVERYFDPLPLWYDTLEGQAPSPQPVAGLVPRQATPGPRAGARALSRARTSGSQAARLRPPTMKPSGEREPSRWCDPLSSTAALGKREPSGWRDPPSPRSALGERESNAPTGGEEFPLHAISQRPMFMYHAWGSQNAWLRQIASRNALYINPQRATEQGIDDGDWVWLVSPHGRIRVEARHHGGTAPGTVWTWNAIGKRRGAWKLDDEAPESNDGFLLNHIIADVLMPPRGGRAMANADPVTGQAAWFDLRVRIERDPQPREPGHRVELGGAEEARA